MSRTGYTRGEWAVWKLAPDSDPDERHIITANDGEDEVTGIIYNPLDAERIAAAVNFIDGIETGAIETLNATLLEMLTTIYSACEDCLLPSQREHVFPVEWLKALGIEDARKVDVDPRVELTAMLMQEFERIAHSVDMQAIEAALEKVSIDTLKTHLRNIQLAAEGGATAAADELHQLAKTLTPALDE